MKIAFFGGTFDPVHNGHLALAKLVLEHRSAGRIMFVPAPNPPHKTDREITPFEVRYEMLALALEGKGEGFALSDIEKWRSGRSYTIDTLNQLSKLYEYDDILLLIGEDSLRQLHSWRQCHEIVRRFGIIAYPRGEEPVSREELRRYWAEEETEKLLSAVLPSAPCFPVSSTEIRGMIRRGEWEKAEALLPPPVMNFIRKNGVYTK